MNKELYFKNKYKKYKKKYLQLKKTSMKGGMIIDNFPTQTEVIYSEIQKILQLQLKILFQMYLIIN